MKRTAHRTTVLALSIIFVIMLIAGCEEERLSDTTSSTKRARLIFAENRQLKEESTQRNTEIEKLKAEIAGQKQLLDKCMEKNRALELQSRRDIEVIVREAFKNPAEENKKLNE